MRKAAAFFRLVKTYGIIGAVVYVFQHFHQRFLKTGHPYILISKYARYPLLCRSGTSDFYVFYQIFVEREYSCIDDFFPVGLVIDGGAYAGYSSAYFLSRFRDSYVIAVEPDPGNYSMMLKNLKPYKNRVKMLNSAIWSHYAPLTMSESKYRDGEPWSLHVRECRPGETTLFFGLDIGSIFKESGYSRISILKIDIEGAEAVIFSSPAYKTWIDKVDVMVIELHDDSSFGKCSEIFFSAMEKEDFEISRCGELTVCKRRHIRQAGGYGQVH